MVIPPEAAEPPARHSFSAPPPRMSERIKARLEDVAAEVRQSTSQPTGARKDRKAERQMGADAEATAVPAQLPWSLRTRRGSARARMATDGSSSVGGSSPEKTEAAARHSSSAPPPRRSERIKARLEDEAEEVRQSTSQPTGTRKYRKAERQMGPDAEATAVPAQLPWSLRTRRGSAKARMATDRSSSVGGSSPEKTEAAARHSFSAPPPRRSERIKARLESEDRRSTSQPTRGRSKGRASCQGRGGAPSRKSSMR